MYCTGLWNLGEVPIYITNRKGDELVGFFRVSSSHGEYRYAVFKCKFGQINASVVSERFPGQFEKYSYKSSRVNAFGKTLIAPGPDQIWDPLFVIDGKPENNELGRSNCEKLETESGDSDEFESLKREMRSKCLDQIQYVIEERDMYFSGISPDSTH
jgi:hypothetical protein